MVKINVEKDYADFEKHEDNLLELIELLMDVSDAKDEVINALNKENKALIKAFDKQFEIANNVIDYLREKNQELKREPLVDLRDIDFSKFLKNKFDQKEECS